MYKLLLLLILLSSTLLSESSESMDSLLDDFAKKSDFSVNTKKDNSGELLLYTRKDLEDMQVRTLNDIVNDIPFFGYAENNFGNPDFFNIGGLYSGTNMIHLYIDNQEISYGIFLSAYGIFGNIDLDFVDHIEIYMISPSYAQTLNSNTILIKLYSKDASRDAGGRVTLKYGSRDTHQETLTYSQNFTSFNYYAYGSHLVENRMPYDSFNDVELSNDRKDIHLFATLKTQDDLIQINYLKREQDAFASMALTAIPQDAYTQTEYFHIGYEREILDNLDFQINYNSTSFNFNHIDSMKNAPIQKFKNEITDKVISAKLQYKMNFENNKILMGINSNYNYFTNKEQINNTQYPKSDYTKQNRTTIFLEDEFDIFDNTLLIAGGKYVYTQNNSDIKDDNYLSHRVGLIYKDNSSIVKFFHTCDELAIFPYAYTSNVYQGKELYNQNIRSSTFSVANRDTPLLAKLTLSYIENTNLISLDFTQTPTAITSHTKTMKDYLTYLNINYTFNQNHEVKSQLAYGKITNIYGGGDIAIINGYLRLFNSFNKFKLFNEFYLFNQLHDAQTDLTVSYSIALSYEYSEELKLSLKANNLFYSAEKKYLPITSNPNNNYQIEPLMHQTEDRVVLGKIEYLF